MSVAMAGDRGECRPPRAISCSPGEGTFPATSVVGAFVSRVSRMWLYSLFRLCYEKCFKWMTLKTKPKQESWH